MAKNKFFLTLRGRAVVAYNKDRPVDQHISYTNFTFRHGKNSLEWCLDHMHLENVQEEKDETSKIVRSMDHLNVKTGRVLSTVIILGQTFSRDVCKDIRAARFLYDPEDTEFLSLKDIVVPLIAKRGNPYCCAFNPNTILYYAVAKAHSAPAAWRNTVLPHMKRLSPSLDKAVDLLDRQIAADHYSPQTLVEELRILPYLKGAFSSKVPVCIMAHNIAWFTVTESEWQCYVSVCGKGTMQGLNLLNGRFRKCTETSELDLQKELVDLWRDMSTRPELADRTLFDRPLRPSDLGFGLCLGQKIWQCMKSGIAGYRGRSKVGPATDLSDANQANAQVQTPTAQLTEQACLRNFEIALQSLDALAYTGE